MDINYYNTGDEALRGLTRQLIDIMEAKPSKMPFNLAISGGETARRMFDLWAKEFRKAVDWPSIRFYWVDERVVPPDHEESNYKYARIHLFEPLQIPETCVYRIKGEEDPNREANCYSELVTRQVPFKNGMPHFDAIILGVGADGHTASIFSSCNFLLDDIRYYAVSKHPESGQMRITMTGHLILNDTPLLIPVLGESKKEILKRLLSARQVSDDFPAACVIHRAESATVFTDIRT